MWLYVLLYFIVLLNSLRSSFAFPVSHHSHSDKPVDEQKRLIRHANDQLHYHLAGGRALQAHLARLGQVSPRNKVKAKEEMEQVGIKMSLVNDEYKKKYGDWIEKEAIHNAAVPNKGEIPLHVEAKRAKFDSYHLRTNWLDKGHWPKSSMSSDDLHHQIAAANEIKRNSLRQTKPKKV